VLSIERFDLHRFVESEKSRRMRGKALQIVQGHCVYSTGIWSNSTTNEI